MGGTKKVIRMLDNKANINLYTIFV